MTWHDNQALVDRSPTQYDEVCGLPDVTMHRAGSTPAGVPGLSALVVDSNVSTSTSCVKRHG